MLGDVGPETPVPKVDSGVVHVRSELLPDAVGVVTVIGEIDLHAASSLRSELTAVSDGAAAIVVVDLSAATFIDSMTLGVLTGAGRRLAQRGGELRIVCVDPNIRRIFGLTLLDRLLPIYPCRTAALERPGTA